VVSGYVGNKCAAFACQQLGLDIDAINTVQFSNHTGMKSLSQKYIDSDILLLLVFVGYPKFAGQVLDVTTLGKIFETLENNALANYTHMLTGPSLIERA